MTLTTQTETRWVGVTPPDGSRLIHLEQMVGRDARRVADFILDGDGDEFILGWRVKDYARIRDQLAREQSIHDRMWKSRMFAGWLVDDRQDFESYVEPVPIH